MCLWSCLFSAELNVQLLFKEKLYITAAQNEIEVAMGRLIFNTP
jgi:hypothetical protein